MTSHLYCQNILNWVSRITFLCANTHEIIFPKPLLPKISTFYSSFPDSTLNYFFSRRAGSRAPSEERRHLLKTSSRDLDTTTFSLVFKPQCIPIYPSSILGAKKTRQNLSLATEILLVAYSNYSPNSVPPLLDFMYSTLSPHKFLIPLLPKLIQFKRLTPPAMTSTFFLIIFSCRSILSSSLYLKISLLLFAFPENLLPNLHFFLLYFPLFYPTLWTFLILLIFLHSGVVPKAFKIDALLLLKKV